MRHARNGGPSRNGGRPADHDEPAEDTLLGVILDRSGSMRACRAATIAGFNEFLQQQLREAAGGRALMSLTQFNHEYDVNFVGEPIENVPELDERSYIPDGRTALHDAIGRTIHEVEAWVRTHRWQHRVLILIITDGLENASREYDLDAVRALIERKEREGWNFAYMGANQDSFVAGGAMGVRSDFTANYAATDAGVRDGFATLSDMTRLYRLKKLKGLEADAFFDPPQERKIAGRLVPKGR